MKQNTFENYLMEVHCRVNPEILDDHLPDHFADWFAELELDDLVKYADEFAVLERGRVLEKIKKRIDNELTPHAFISNDPVIERIVQDEKIKHRDKLLRDLETLKQSLKKDL